MKKSLTTGTLIILAAGLIIKLIGFATRILISNTVGAEGLGLFQLFYPMYSLVILTICSGITIAQSGLISAAAAHGRWNEVGKINFCAAAITLAISTAVGVGIFFLADIIAGVIFSDDRLAISFKVFAPFVPLITLGAVFRGFFYGVGNLLPPAISGIVEQIAKIAVIMAFASYALQFGLAYSCMIIAFGLIVGEVANLLVLVIAFGMRKRAHDVGKSSAGYMEVAKQITRISIPVSINRLIMSALGAMEMVLIKNALINFGMDYSFSLEEFGRLTGMVMPLIFFPMVLTNAISTTVVPGLSEAEALGDIVRTRQRISKALVFSISSGFVFTAIFISYPGEIGWMAYKSVKCQDMIYLMGFSCIFLYLQQTLIGILNGLGKQGVLLINILLGFILRLGGIFLLMPVMGIGGYIYGFIASSLLVCVFNFAYLSKFEGIMFEAGRWIVRPLCVTCIMVLASEFVMNSMKSFVFNDRLGILIAIGIISVFGYFLMFVARVLDIKDLGFLFPKKDRMRR